MDEEWILMVNDAVESMDTPQDDEKLNAVSDPSTDNNAATSPEPTSDTVSEITPEAVAENIAPEPDASVNAAVESDESAEVVEEASVAEVGDAVSEATPEAEVAAVNSIADLSVKQAVTGVVTKVMLAGAIVELAPNIQGFLHISQLGEKRVKNVTDVVKEGDKITAYVLDIDSDKQRVILTLIKPPALTWPELQNMVNQNVTGKVVRIEKFGAFVDIGAERPGLIHVSELSDDYISSPEDKVSVGDEIEARIIGVDLKKRQVDLSLKALTAKPTVLEDEDDDVPMTAMEIAMRRALVKQQKKARKAKSK
ncbi:MAG: hypothetical protein CUN55_07680 [Phototrophicales bacterium]|nr:MAG: hypothetical protein CUN55_07680 [Phototrophicales bacterium]